MEQIQAVHGIGSIGYDDPEHIEEGGSGDNLALLFSTNFLKSNGYNERYSLNAQEKYYGTKNYAKIFH